MNLSKHLNSLKVKIDQDLGLRRALLLAILFFIGVLLIALNRYYSFYASYDHGLFNQLFWNNLHGNFFQSSLTSANSVASLEDGVIPIVSFIHLGQHFVIDFLVWLPLYALFPHPVTMIVLQVGLIAIAGLVLYLLARHYLQPALALWIAGGYYAGNAVIGPTLANFYEHCQIPLFAFCLLLALEKKRWLWFWISALLILGVREEIGILLFGVGVYLVLSRRHIGVGIGLCVLSFGYVAVITNLVMPRFSDDSARLYLATRFSQFVQSDHPSTLQVLWGMLTHPLILLSSLLTPFDRRLGYLAAHWLPMAFVPALSPASWTIAGFPLLVLFLQAGKSALAINLRYALTVVPGLYYGAILWWSQHPQSFTPKFRRFWSMCIALSLIFTISSNPNRALSFVIPDSLNPQVYVPLNQQWNHANQIRSVLRSLPDEVSVSATTYIIPHLSSRRAIIRLPAMKFRTTPEQVNWVEYAIADLWQLERYQVAFKEERPILQAILTQLENNVATNQYGVLQVQDGIVLMAKGKTSNSDALKDWKVLRDRLKA